MQKAIDNLSDYLEMIPDDYENLHQHDIKVSGGHLISTGIVNNRHMSICRMHITNKGITSDWHTHAEAETFILNKGASYYMEIKGIEYCVKVSKDNSCHVPPDTPHRLAGTDGESWSILVLVPGSVTFPVGVNNGR